MREVETCMHLRLTHHPSFLGGLGIGNQPPSCPRPQVLDFRFKLEEGKFFFGARGRGPGGDNPVCVSSWRCQVCRTAPQVQGGTGPPMTSFCRACDKPLTACQLD